MEEFETNNDLLKQIRDALGGGSAGKSQLLIEDGAITAGTTVALIAGGSAFTIADPTDGQILILANATGAAYSVTGNINGEEQTQNYDDHAGGCSIWVGIDMTPAGGSGVSWQSIEVQGYTPTP